MPIYVHKMCRWKCQQNRRRMCCVHRLQSEPSHSNSNSRSQCVQTVQTSAKAFTSTKSDQEFKSDIRINPDSDPNVCRISATMLWIHYLVGISHLAKCHENQPVTVQEMWISLLKSPIPVSRKWKSDLESIGTIGSRPKRSQFFRLLGSIMTPSFNEISWLLLQ